MFNVGDVVTVNPTLSATKPDGTGWEVGICDAMLSMAGQIATIESVLNEDVNGEKVYKLAFDGRRSVWSWQESMLIAGESTTPKIELPETCMDTLATYPHTDEEKTAKAKQIADLIDKYDYTYTMSACDKIVAENFATKGWIYNLFSKHPNWDGDGHVVIKSNIKRPLDMQTVREFCTWCIEIFKRTYIKQNELRVGMFTLKEYVDIIHKYERMYENLPDGAVLNGKTRYEYRSEVRRMHAVYANVNTKNDVCTLDCMMVSRKVYTEYRQFCNLLENLLIDKLDKENPTLINKRQEKIVAEIIDSGYFTFKEKPVVGQKICKYIGKICKFYGINKFVEMKTDVWYDQDGTRHERAKDYGYNYHFAALGDAINPNEIERDVVLSVDIMDFLTMSFGYKWASCMTIDKENMRGVTGAHYSGCYSGGTLSYGLDKRTFVAYVRPTESELASIGESNLPMEEQSKFKRCLFFLGEDKLIQSRVYPDGRDLGEEGEGIATQIRNIVQKAIADMLNVSNMWTLKRGQSACCEVIDTAYGSVHYRDYEFCSDCNVSYLRRVDGLINKKRIKVGAEPICPNCGDRHQNSEAIVCSPCFNDEDEDAPHCSRCGDRVDEDDAIWIDDEVYCCSECAEASDNVYTEDDGWHYYEDCRQDDWSGDWYYNYEDGIDTKDGHWYIDEDSAERAGYTYVDYNDGWYKNDEVVYDEESDTYFVPGETYGYVETEDGKYFINENTAADAGYVQVDGTWVQREEEDEAV